MKTFLVFLLLPLSAVAGNNSFTGNARMDLVTVSPLDSLPQSTSVMVQNQVDHSKLKKPLLGGAMSLLVPGAGEFYSDRYLKSGIFSRLKLLHLRLRSSTIIEEQSDRRISKLRQPALERGRLRKMDQSKRRELRSIGDNISNDCHQPETPLSPHGKEWILV